MKPTRTLPDCARTISGSRRPVEAAPTIAALRVKINRREGADEDVFEGIKNSFGKAKNVWPDGNGGQGGFS